MGKFGLYCAQRRLRSLCAHDCCYIGRGAAISNELSVDIKYRVAAFLHVHLRTVAAHRAIYKVTERLPGIDGCLKEAPLCRFRFKVERVIRTRRANPIRRVRAKRIFRQLGELVIRTGFPKPIGSCFSIVAELRFAFPQCFLSALPYRYIHLCRDNLNKFSAAGERRSADCFKVLDRPVGEYNSVRGRVISSLAHRALNFCAQPLPVVGMDSLEHGFATWNPLRRVKSPDAVRLLRSIENRRLAVGRHAAVTQPLCFRQVGLAAASRLFYLLPSTDVNTLAIPLDDASLPITQRLTANIVPTKFAVRPAETVHAL